MWSDASKRYKTQIADIFSENNKLSLQLRVEAELAKVQAKLNLISEEEAALIAKATQEVTITRVKAIESEIHHDVMAVVKALSEKSGKAGEKVHLGATSSDIQDTILALQLTESKILLLDILDELSSNLITLADKYASEACIGRTHGQFAVPTTVGFKFANYLYELYLAKCSLHKTPTHIAKFSGAVGNYASLMRSDIEIKLLQNLGLEPAEISTQVVTRVLQSQYMHSLALCASVIERISKEIRNLQRSEIQEWLEPFSGKQVGSSAMPHKRNPHKSERISGLARIIRSNVGVSLENIALEHERDISHSSVERIIIPESSNLLYYITDQMNKILKNLEINKGKIRINLRNASASASSEQILRLLVPIIGRQEGHSLLRNHVTSKDFEQSILSDEKITKYIPRDRLEEIIKSINVGLAVKKTKQIIDFHAQQWTKYRELS
ncbi:MAG: adenylosuccinate lyase [Candidatus Kariarchaeaceae archaeon]